MKNILISILFLFVVASLKAFVAVEWTINEEYSIKFSGSGANGTFRGLTGTIVFDPELPDQSSFDVSVDASTISTGNKTKDKHARGSSWFDVRKYPEISFKSQHFKKVGSGYEVKGTLDMHGVRKEVTIPFVFKANETGGLFEGNFKIDREDFEITGPLFGFMVGDEFDITLKIPVGK
ncbi:YceI family protein [Fulvivirga sp. M361]|uniref:YceI family protein n=1 Tax=Fulvivirga sp. M361 TaxID=2594266 RepID=UPI00117A3642|nr:YceI family protein [Fulvivirga sp. M361]TRX62544.1 YceI family protein [Fulvivirga sp. M361]